MATGKKFYWIKLRRDFMSGDIVDFLMSQRNGAQYVVLYQMLCMMCINTKGALSRQIGELIIPFDIDKIQRDCKYFSRDTITIALELFKKLGLVYEQDAGVLAITGFENLVGYETDYAIQKRNQRQMIGVSMDKIEDGEKDNSMDKEEYSPVDNVHEQVSRNIDGQIEDSNTDMDVDNVHTEIPSFGNLKKIEVFYPEQLNGYVCVGIAKGTDKYDNAKSLLEDNQLPDTLLVDHELLDGYVRLPICAKTFIDSLGLINRKVVNGQLEERHFELSKEKKDVLGNIYDLYDNNEELKKKVVEKFMVEWQKRKALAYLCEWWNSIPNIFEITAVGKVLAHSNAQRCDKSIPPME